MTTEELAKAIAKALDEKKAENIKIYDVRGISSVTDVYIVASGTSAPHLRALIAGVQGEMKEMGVMSHRSCGEPESGWMVVDYFQAVLHVFTPEARAYYNIEELWEKAKLIQP